MNPQHSIEQQLKFLLQQGLPIHSRPYEQLARQVVSDEATVYQLIQRWQQEGLIRRMGAIADHHKLGYQANAMVVFDVPGHLVDELGQRIAATGQVNLCYRRPRRPQWPYNLFCMIHGRERDQVLQAINDLRNDCELHAFSYDVLFSRRQFKQCGGSYFRPVRSGDNHYGH